VACERCKQTRRAVAEAVRKLTKPCSATDRERAMRMLRRIVAKRSTKEAKR
jgi:hypothetical protein